MLGILAGSWLICSASLYALQDRLLYAGGARSAVGSPNGEVVRDPQGRPWGWVAEPGFPARATIVFFHGNSGRADERWQFYREPFTERGYRIVFAEYPGYGDRGDKTPSAQALQADALQLLLRVQERYRDAPLWVAGESLGAAVAAQVAEQGGADRVLLLTPWHRLTDLAAEKLPWLPMRLIVRAKYDSCESLQGLAPRVRLVYAQKDPVIPPGHALSLAACLHLEPDQVQALPNSGHNNWALSMTPAQWNALLAP